jgi:hypothetical protein
VLDLGVGVRGMDVRAWEGTEALERHRLLVRMIFAVETRDRHYADRILVETTRWLKRQNDGDDPVIREALKQLRAEFPPVH